jgi:NADH-quinone oxidoreductase subunit M
MLTILLVGLPLLFSLLVWVAGDRYSRGLAMIGALAGFILTLFSLSVHSHNPGSEMLSFQLSWLPQLGVSFSLAADGIALLMIFLANLLLPLIVFSSFSTDYKHQHVLYSMMLLMQSAMVGSFLATDGFLFYIFWEVALIPIYLICLIWGAENSNRITLKFFLYTLAGSLFMLAALIYIYLQTPDNSFAIQSLYVVAREMSLVEQSWIFGAFFLAFAIKMPIFPLHTWQPGTYFTAPIAGVMMLSAIMLKMATYGMIRWVLPMVPDGVELIGPFAMGLCIASILYGSFMAVVQKDFKLLIAFASIAHVGLICTGILSNNVEGIQGSLADMLSHGVNTVGLFFVCDIIERRTGTGEMKYLSGIRAVNAPLGFLFFVILMGSIGLPFTNGFVGEFLMLLGIFKYYWLAGVLAGLSIILGAIYMLRAFQKIMLGEPSHDRESFPPLTGRERSLLYILVVLIIGFGVYPTSFLIITEDSVIALLDSLK